MMQGFAARFQLTQGAFHLDFQCQIPGRGITTIFGPSGAGKTTVLRCLAGLQRAPEGHCYVHDECWQDETRNVFVPPHRRPVGYVFQEARLFPHLTVRRNLEYGLRRTSTRSRRMQLHEAIDWLGIKPFLDRYPSRLSGGEAQRVAIARAFLVQPRLLLMDEPVSSLDDAGKHAILTCLDQLPETFQIPIVFVSHSLRDVGRLADEMIWMEQGRVKAAGPLQQVIARVDFASSRGEEAGTVIETAVSHHDEAYHLTALDGPAGNLWVRQLPYPPGHPVRVQIFARDVSLSMVQETHSSILNILPVVIDEISETEPGQVLVRLKCGAKEEPSVLLARITRKSADQLALAPGMEIFARVKSVSLME